jgi:hypothetical protein
MMGIFGNRQLKSPQELTQEIERDFDRAKRMSDFIGMIVRFAIACYATSYFWSQFIKKQDFPWSYVVGVCMTAAFAFTVLFGFRIGSIITLYSIRDTGNIKNRVFRAMTFVMSTAAGISLLYGILDFALSLPKPGVRP